MPRRSPCILLAGVLSLTACERPQAPDAAEPAGPGAGQVTQSRVLAEADSGDNWLVNGGRFSGEHFSPQSRISEENIGELGLAWATDIPSPIGLSAEPLVIDGGVTNSVIAVDAATGVYRWHYRTVPEDALANYLGEPVHRVGPATARHGRHHEVPDRAGPDARVVHEAQRLTGPLSRGPRG